ncbi:MAG: nuclear transport factor 2 family protein [Gemmatimonadota bacterium]
MNEVWKRPRIAGALPIALLALALAAIPARGQSPGEPAPATAADSTAIRQAALDYIEGWYEGDAERMKRAVHPRLEKRILGSELGAPIPLVEMTAMELVDATRRGGGSDAPGPGRADVAILDIFGRAASVRVDADGWVDYLHLVHTEEGWKIVNVLWELRAPETDDGPTG